MEYLKGEFKTRFRDLQVDFELRSEELKALLSDAHSHALVSAHALGDDDVKSITAEYTSRLDVLSITHKEKLAMVESLHEIKLDTQKNEFSRKLEQATTDFENELKKRNIAYENDVTDMENVRHCCYVMLCYAMLCYVMLCYFMLSAYCVVSCCINCLLYSTMTD